MQGEVALVHEHGQDFAILAVKNSVITNPSKRQEMLDWGGRAFGRRTALLAEDGRTWGPNDIVNWLRGVAVEQLPWRSFTIG